MIKRFSSIRFIFLNLALALLVGCHVEEKQDKAILPGGKPEKLASFKSSEEERAVYLKEITALARELDKGYEDGWICGRNSRVHKSGYRLVSPEMKAEFALAYQQMLNQSGQNLAVEVNSYVPYSKRFEFALNWWQQSKAVTQFDSQSTKKKVVWVHESLLDGSELFWRAFENENQGAVNSVSVMAHDKEQDMVFNYMEAEGMPGNYSEQYSKWSKVLEPGH